MKAILLVTLLALTNLAANPAKPAIVVFLSDDHGQLDSTPYGATDVRTPQMKRLATEGLTFERAFIASPACAPSRAAMLTGLMPARNGAEANHQYKRDTVQSLPAFLRLLGYQTAAFGKIAHNKQDTTRHGFDVMDESYDPGVVEKVKRYHERPAVELYDLKADAYEQHNLAAEPAQAERVAELKSRLETWMREQGDQQTVFDKPRLLTDPQATEPNVKRAGK